MQKVDFIGIGVQKAATSWLFSCLKEHPQIRVAVDKNNKELNFFNYNYVKGYTCYHQRFEFGSWKTGEYSPSYFSDKNVPERIYLYNPKVKLIVSLRNPIERAFSQHLHEIRRNRLPKELYDFWDALEQNPTYVEQSKYSTHLERYLNFFDFSQLHVILFEEIVSKPKEVIKEIFRFLEVDDSFVPSVLARKINVAHTYRSRSLHRFIRTASRVLRASFGDAIVETLKATRLPEKLRHYNEVQIDNSIVSPLSNDDRRKLLDIFYEELENLNILLKRDLSNWR
jgi:hypothetical protein